jgi:uncharacterized protein YcaQ
MTAAQTIPAEVARRFLVLRHLLAPPRSVPGDRAGVMSVFDRLGSIQFDPLDVAGRNHDLVLLARVQDYRRELTDGLLYEDRHLYETYNKGLSLVPTAELPFYRITWDLNRAEHEGAAFDEHAPLVEELLTRIRDSGPMAATDVAPRAAIDWYWRPTNQVRAILEALAQSGILGLSRRDGNRRIYDLVERLFPADLLARRIDIVDQRRHKLLSRYRAHGLLGAHGQAEVWLGTGPTAAERAERRVELIEAGAVVPVAVEGFKETRYAVADELSLLDQARQEVALESGGGPMRPGGQQPGVSFLGPLDPLVWDRSFLRELWGFDYLWEVYVPAAKRRWGYYVLPVLWGDRFVGRIEPRIDRRAGTIRVIGLWWEKGFDPTAEEGFVAAFADALEAHRRFAGSSAVTLPRTAAARAVAREIRASGRRTRNEVDREPVAAGQA